MNHAPKTLMEMHGIKLRLAGKEILAGVDLSLRPQATLVVMGLSGGGKTTLLRILLGLLPASEGSVRFRDRELTTLSRAELNQIRTHIGMVYQNAALISSMSVRDNVALPLKELSDKSEREIEAIVEEKLKLAGLEVDDVKDKLPAELSGGMQKRVGLARALVLEPELVLFDEPSTGLDPINARHIDDLIIDLRERHQAASIVVTHEMESAFAIATQMAFLHEGKIILDGTPDDFRYSNHPIVGEFVSSSFDHITGNSHEYSQK